MVVTPLKKYQAKYFWFVIRISGCLDSSQHSFVNIMKYIDKLIKYKRNILTIWEDKVVQKNNKNKNIDNNLYVDPTITNNIRD